jgi:AbrB family looped-hinge helix DNA binding protein
MALARSKLTAQSQISVPAPVRKKLGVGPGSLIEWDEQDDHVIVRRAGWYTSEEIHAALFRESPPDPKTEAELKEGIRKRMRKRYAER